LLADRRPELTLQDVTDAFSVEELNKEFFADFCRARGALTDEIHTRSRLTEDHARAEAQTILNRLLFLYFLQRKGWLHRDRDYIAAAFRRIADADADGSDFYAKFLAPVFGIVSTEWSQREKTLSHLDETNPHRHDLPFLNGGLFADEIASLDDNVKRRRGLRIGNAVFPRVFTDLFERYNFTIHEDSERDAEVAVDPEMLGKVFEELVTGRHESGSYYTPKPIVAFMCREALKHHLARACPPEDTAALARFVDDHDPAALRDGEAVLAALRAVRVCDPACGSGAYLLGMLHELLDLRECLFATRKIGADNAHARKLEIIQHNLYGVDLDPFAVNIARLRLWLSLAVEFEGASPPPLPNLDFKIEAGDSLAAPDPHAAFAGQGALRDQLVGKFREKKAAFLLAHDEEKKRLRSEVAEIKRDLAVWLHSGAPAGAFDWAIEFAEVFAPRPAPAEHSHPGCADRGHPARRAAAQQAGSPLTAQAGSLCSGGFDIIVANPPYVRMELIKPLKPMLRRNFAAVHDERTDLYVYFYARAHELLRPGGVAAFISSNKWLRAGYGEKLRQLLLDAQAFHLVADFGELPVFQTAATFPAIFVWEKSPRGETTTAWSVVKHGGRDAHPTRAHPEYIGPRNPTVEKISWSRDTVWVDKAQTTGFRGVREPVWNFHIGGYQVCQKWLKDRKGRTLTKDDLAHYQKIVIALAETIRLMAEIDQVIDAHGGWPDAFATVGKETA